MRVIAGAPDQIQTMYNVLGEKRLDEIELPLLPGYENSRPVRIGNAAHTQLQLDIYGELADVAAQGRAGGLPDTLRGRQLRAVIMGHLEKTWCLPDEGIWEIRGEPRHFVYSKVMTWVAFDRVSRAPDSTPRQKAHWKKMARRIHADICKKGVDSKTRLFRAVLWITRSWMRACCSCRWWAFFLPPIRASKRQCARSRSG